jgi:hypothetical protein
MSMMGMVTFDMVMDLMLIVMLMLLRLKVAWGRNGGV